MTTTQDLIARAAAATTVGLRGADIKPGVVLYDPAVVPYTGLGYVFNVVRQGVTIEIQMEVVMEDGTTASDDACYITWHSTLPISAIPDAIAGYDPYTATSDGGYFASCAGQDETNGTELADALAEVI